MKQTETLLDRFAAAVGQKLQEVSGVPDTYYERSRATGFPRIIYTATVWTSDDALRGTLSCTISGNTQPSEVDRIAGTLLHELEGFSQDSEQMLYYLHSGRISPNTDSDRSVYIRILTFDFFVVGG